MVNFFDKIGQKMSRRKTTGAGSSVRRPATSQSVQPRREDWTFLRPRTSRANTRVPLSETSSVHGGASVYGDSTESLVEQSGAGPSEDIDMTLARSLLPTTRLPTADIDRSRRIIGNSLNRHGEQIQPFDHAKWDREQEHLQRWRQKLDDEERDKAYKAALEAEDRIAVNRKSERDQFLRDGHLQDVRTAQNIGLALPMHPPRPKPVRSNAFREAPGREQGVTEGGSRRVTRSTSRSRRDANSEGSHIRRIEERDRLRTPSTNPSEPTNTGRSRGRSSNRREER